MKKSRINPGLFQIDCFVTAFLAMTLPRLDIPQRGQLN